MKMETKKKSGKKNIYDSLKSSFFILHDYRKTERIYTLIF